MHLGGSRCGLAVLTPMGLKGDWRLGAGAGDWRPGTGAGRAGRGLGLGSGTLLLATIFANSETLAEEARTGEKNKTSSITAQAYSSKAPLHHCLNVYDVDI